MKARAWIALVLVLACLCSACAVTERSLVGTWKYQQAVLGVVTETTYEFREDGTGTVTNLVTLDMTYTLTEDKLEITSKVLGIPNTEVFTVSFDGNTLVMTGEDQTMRLEKVK